jgi:hypothetical protein
MVRSDHILEKTMARPSDPPGPPVGPLPAHGLLTPPILRDVADLNRRYLDLALEPTLADDPRFALPDEIRAPLRSGGTGLLGRVAACPFALFQVSLAHCRLGVVEGAAGVEDARRRPVDSATIARTHSFQNVAVFLAWRLADGQPLAFRITLGLSTTDELLLNQTRQSDLPGLANTPQLIRPRWIGHLRFWRLLVPAASAPGEATLQRVHCAGICMIVADLHGPDGRPLGTTQRDRL